jgi:CRP/FNR family cyclic AMP-dependent transcriptional regulator
VIPTDVSALERVRFLSGLSGRQLRKLARTGRTRRFKPGTTVVREGQMSGVGFFIVVEGEASVLVRGQPVATLGPGDHFGEVALIRERERTATVTAETALECLELTAWEFRKFVKSNPEASWRLLQHLAALLEQANSRLAVLEKPGEKPT